MAILDTTVVSVAQRTFIKEFATTQAVVAWTMTGYTLALATVIPLTGWAADRFGTKPLFMGSVMFFALGSLLCAMAPNITLLVAFRVVQGLGGGMLMPLTFTILTREAGPKRLGRLMAVLGIPMLLGPIGGPILGGWLIDSFSWEWIFRINRPIGLLAFGLAAIVFGKDTSVKMKRTRPKRSTSSACCCCRPASQRFSTGCRRFPAAARWPIGTCGYRRRSAWRWSSASCSTRCCAPTIR
jgi:DHA2 family multidrug resistance protein